MEPRKKKPKVNHNENLCHYPENSVSPSPVVCVLGYYSIIRSVNVVESPKVSLFSTAAFWFLVCSPYLQSNEAMTI